MGNVFRKRFYPYCISGKNIDDVLHLPVSAGIDFFSDNAFISSRLKVMAKLGLGYMQIGQAYAYIVPEENLKELN